MNCSKCKHPMKQHFDDKGCPIKCTNHKTVIDGDLYDTGFTCDCEYFLQLELKGG